MELQELIVETAVTFPIESISDRKLALEIWFQAVIKETGEADLRAGYRLILSKYENGYLDC